MIGMFHLQCAIALHADYVWYTRLQAKNARKDIQPCLALFYHHSNVFFQTELHKINESWP